MKNKTKSHAPIFRGLKHNSTTVCAYCPNCKTILKRYKQEKCLNCDFDIYWEVNDETKRKRL